MTFLQHIRRRVRQRYCRHRFYLDDLHRVADNLVRCPCHRCGKVCSVEYGLLLPGSFDRRNVTP